MSCPRGSSRSLQALIDWGQSIYHEEAEASGSSSVEPLSPMARSDAEASGSSSVEPLSPMARSDAEASGSSVFGCFVYWLMWFAGSDRLGTIDGQ